MNITFINKKKFKNKTSYILAGTIALTSVFGLTGCSEGYVMAGSDLENVFVLSTMENGNLLVEKIYPDSCDTVHYRDKISNHLYCTLKGKDCKCRGCELYIEKDSIIKEEPIYFYLTEDEIVKDEFQDEEIVKIYKRINK